MEGKIYSINDKNRKSVIITEGTINVSSKSYSDPVKFRDSIKKGKSLLSLETITYFYMNDVTKVTLPIDSTELTIHYYSHDKQKDTSIYLNLGREGEAEELARFIATSKGYSEHKTEMTIWKSIQGPLGGILTMLAVGWLIYSYAADLENGAPIDISGKNQLIQNLLLFFAEKLGRVGAIAVTLLPACYFVYNLYKKIKNRPKEYIFE